MPDDDCALGQNEVDVRNESRKPLNATTASKQLALIAAQKAAAKSSEDESPDKEKD